MIAMSGAMCLERENQMNEMNEHQLDKTRKLDRKKRKADSSELEHRETVSRNLGGIR